MVYTITLTSEELIDALEAKLGTIYENIKEDDKVEEVRLTYHGIEITIGE